MPFFKLTESQEAVVAPVLEISDAADADWCSGFIFGQIAANHHLKGIFCEFRFVPADKAKRAIDILAE